MSYGGIIGQQPALEASGISYNNNQTSSIITGDNVQTAIDQLFTSVSNGKNKIASAITDKGISTSPNDSFDVMAGNIGKIQSLPKYRVVQDFSGQMNDNTFLTPEYKYKEGEEQSKFVLHIRFKYKRNYIGTESQPSYIVSSPWDFYCPCFMFLGDVGSILDRTKLWMPLKDSEYDGSGYLEIGTERSHDNYLRLFFHIQFSRGITLNDGIEKLQILYQED